MPLYRNKPVIIEAVTWYGKYGDGTEWPDWIRKAVDQGNILLSQDGDDPVKCSIVTLEGVMFVSINDKIIQGVQGEIYPCKPDIFEATYEAVED